MKEANFSNLQWQRLSGEELKLTKDEEELNFTLAYELCIVGYMKDIGITNEPRLVHSYFHYYHILHSKLYICSALFKVLVGHKEDDKIALIATAVRCLFLFIYELL